MRSGAEEAVSLSTQAQARAAGVCLIHLGHLTLPVHGATPTHYQTSPEAQRARPMPRKLILSHNVQQARPGRAHAAIGAGSKHRPTPPADGGGGRPQRARNQLGKRGAHMMRGGRGRGRCWEAASDGDAPSSSARSAVGPRLGWERPSHGLPGAKNPGEFRGATLRGPDGKHTHTHTHAGKNAHARVGAQGLKKHTSAN